jgi:sigma-B regulation protein RsbU (phosphoserine phosphatase)
MAPPRSKSTAQNAREDRYAGNGKNVAHTEPTSPLSEGLDAAGQGRSVTDISVRLENFLIDVADTLNSTLEMDKLLRRVAELVRQVIDYEIFAILLLNERTQELRMRFQIGHTPEVERLKIKVGQGVTGMAVERRHAVLVDNVLKEPRYINAHPLVRSELAVPLIAKKRVIGVIDIQASKESYFTDEHSRILTLVASRARRRR